MHVDNDPGSFAVVWIAKPDGREERRFWAGGDACRYGCCGFPLWTGDALEAWTMAKAGALEVAERVRRLGLTAVQVVDLDAEHDARLKSASRAAGRVS